MLSRLRILEWMPSMIGLHTSRFTTLDFVISVLFLIANFSYTRELLFSAILVVRYFMSSSKVGWESGFGLLSGVASDVQSLGSALFVSACIRCALSKLDFA